MGKKNVRVLGTQSYINPNTGEIIDMQVIETEESNKDFNFHKLFMRDFIAALDLVGNQKTKVCYWLIDNINKDNMLLFSYRQIAEKTGICYDTVARTIKTLIDADFLRKSGKVLIVNPDIIFKGTAQRRANVLHTYRQAETGDTELNMQKRIDCIQATIDGLNKQLQALLMTQQGQAESQLEEICMDESKTA